VAAAAKFKKKIAFQSDSENRATQHRISPHRTASRRTAKPKY
jgi:hypothetical protein